MAATAAGLFSADRMAASFHYIGGACDNPNVLDKEAGVLAMQAFLSLYAGVDHCAPLSIPPHSPSYRHHQSCRHVPNCLPSHPHTTTTTTAHRVVTLAAPRFCYCALPCCAAPAAAESRLRRNSPCLVLPYMLGTPHSGPAKSLYCCGCIGWGIFCLGLQVRSDGVVSVDCGRRAGRGVQRDLDM